MDIPKIAVAVLTFKRNDGLSKLLVALAKQDVPADIKAGLSVVIVDNDPNGGAGQVVADFQKHNDLNIIYEIEGRAGIPIARNRALDLAPADTDLFCFIDDDEWPCDGWLQHLLTAYRNSKADCVHGPVIPVYPKTKSNFFIKTKVFECKKFPNEAKINFAATNNVLFNLKLFRELEIRFSERMRFTGGSDYLFFKTAVQKGVKINWASEAIVYEDIPHSRMTWRWILQRQYRLGNTFAVSDRVQGGLRSRIWRICYGVARVGLGLVTLPAMPISNYWGMRGLVHLLRGAGMVAGTFGHDHQEYLRSDQTKSA